MKKSRLKLSIMAMAFIAAAVASILIILLISTRALASGMLDNQAKTANTSFANILEDLQESALERAEMIAGSKDVVNAIEDNDYDALLAALKNYSTGVDLITLCDADGIVLARTHNDKVGDSVLSQKAIATALSTGKGIKTMEPGTVIGLSTRGSAAIKDKNGKIIGALTCGHDLSLPVYIDKVKAQNNCEAAFFAGDERMSTTLTDESGNRIVGKKADPAIVKTVIDEKKDFTGRIDLLGSVYQAYYSPVIVDGQAIGMISTNVKVEEVVNQENQMVILIVTSTVLLILAVIITVLIIRNTINKSYWYESLLDSIPFPISVTDNNMNWTFVNKSVEQMLSKKREDIMGLHCSNWGAAICKTEKCGVTCLNCNKPVTYFGQGDMDFRVDTSYINDSKGNRVGHIEVVQDISATVSTQKAQSELVQNINEIIDSFISGSRQIADGAQALASGSTQQAASVEELSSSIGEISEKTKNNVDMAERAFELAETIKQNAEKGNNQMEQMINAVNDINDASQSINKVIKVIDDIAFQTNILALNAAVEAARAGSHGKGFAVVAEEVRNLAAKSAEAAKDTESLIENSIKKAELGVKIASDTAVSLTEIVSGINESSSLIGQITKLSEEQSVRISQINIGIDQVSNVVQQNSATAQESAASSQHMSSQVSVLDDFITSFKARTEDKK